MHLHDIAFYVALFFIIGVAAAGFGINIWLTLFVSLVITFVVINPKKFIAIFLGITFLGFFYFNFHAVLQKEVIPFGDDTTFEGVVARQPKHGLRSQQLDIELNHPYEGEVRIYTETAPRYEFGDKLQFSGTVEKSPSGRLNTISFPDIEVVGKGEGNAVKSALFKVKNSMVANINAVLSPQHAALMSGILFGERAEFTEEFDEAMRRSGTTHIVALSGYNVAIIGITLSAALAYVMKRRYAFYVSMAAIPAFVIMTGAEASVVRAGIMGVILLIAERQSRLYSFRNAVALTALVMILFNPRLLVFDLGFQLSFAALLGIVYLYPLFKKWFKVPEEGGVLGWRRNLFQTLSAQLAVAPIILTSFGYFSPTALIANVLILEFIPITMLFGFLTATLGFASYSLSLILGWLTSIFLGYEIFIINLFSLNWL